MSDLNLREREERAEKRLWVTVGLIALSWFGVVVLAYLGMWILAGVRGVR